MIDITKKYKTRAGLSVRFLCDDGPDSHYPIIGIIDGSYYVTTWTHDGLKDKNKPMHGDNLVEVKEKIRVERWINIYRYGEENYIRVINFKSKDHALAEPELKDNIHHQYLAVALPFVWEGEEPS